MNWHRRDHTTVGDSPSVLTTRDLLRMTVSVLVVVSISCSSPDAVDLLPIAPSLSTPFATGLVLTSQDPTPIGIWRSPSGYSGPPSRMYNGSAAINDISAGIPTSYSFPQPYPTPSSGPISLEFGLPAQSVVSAWIVRARWAGDPGEDIHSVVGGTVNTPDLLPVVILVGNRILNAGRYMVTWNAHDGDGTEVPAGFYRVYVRAAGLVMWHDVMIFHALADLPPDLRALIDPGRGY